MSKKSEFRDPLEAAKIQAPESPPQPSQVAPTLAPPPKAAPQLEEPVLPPPGPPPAPPEVYKVVGRHTISWSGQFIKLNPGDLISERLYGAGAIQRMRDAGVALEPA